MKLTEKHKLSMGFGIATVMLIMFAGNVFSQVSSFSVSPVDTEGLWVKTNQEYYNFNGDTLGAICLETGVMDRFSGQEKRILSVFFENHDMALSYVDIARALGKSHHTIKNQMHQITSRADLFDVAVDHGQRKRFRLKDNVKIEKHLKMNKESI